MSPSVELLPADPAWAPLLLRWRQQPLSVAFNPLLPLDEEGLRARLARGTPPLDDPSADHWRWFVAVGQELVGSVSLGEVNRVAGNGILGWMTGAEHQGRGLATAAVSALVHKLFRETALVHLGARITCENTASCRVAEKVGFRRDGRLRGYCRIGGVPRDQWYYGLVRGEER